MKKNRAIAILLSCIMVLGVFSFAACGKTYMVTFDSAGGGAIASQTVKEGGKAEKPADPEQVGYIFDGWHLNDVPYSFDAEVTKDITLVAKWKTAQYSVTFRSEGLADDVKTVVYGNAAVKPANPQRDGYVFDGWYLGTEKYDFETPVTQDIVITARWLNESDLNAELAAALSADYSNFTSVRTVTEVEDKTVTSYAITYKRTATALHIVSNPKSVVDRERYIVFDSNGRTLSGYYVDDKDNWVKSGLVTFDGLYPAMKITGELSTDDFAYVDGEYVAYDESVGAVEYALFRTSGELTSVSLKVEGGKIAAVNGVLSISTESDVITLNQTFTGFGTTQVEKPSGLPAVNVVITKKDKAYTEGDGIAMNELLALFTVKADDKEVTLTENMLNLGTLDLSAPAVGSHTLTLTYVAWDGTSGSETATVTINAKQAATGSFAQIFAKDYTNATIELTGPTTTTSVVYKRNNNLYFWTAGVTNNYALVSSTVSGGTTTLKRATHNTNVGTKQSYTTHTKIARLDLVFALDASLFEDKGDGKYEFKPDAGSVDTLKAIFKYCESMASAVIYTDDPDTYPFSLIVTVDGDYVSKIECSFYYKMSTSATSYTARSYTMTLSDIGTTDTIDTSEVDSYLQ